MPTIARAARSAALLALLLAPAPARPPAFD
jgi:hypothetical protein